MKDKSAFKSALILARLGYWDIAVLHLKKAYGR